MGFTFATLFASACLGISTLSGTVVDAAGQAIPGAHVYVEAGLAAPLQEAVAGPDGAFRFEDLGKGETGVFAYAPGHAFGGQHLNIAVEDNPPPLTIHLGEADEVSGKVVGGKNVPIQGALITRVALLGADKVGIPLAKLKEFGIPLPTSDAEGRFTVPNLPKGGSVALKFTHGQFAVEGLDGVSVGDRNLKVQLYLGILVEGDVVARNDGQAIANAPVLIRNAQPPHDTTLTNSDPRGHFSVRLKPGVYLYQAAGANIQSSGWTKLALSGEEPTAKLRIAVGGLGTIRGEVRDAKTSQPIPGARVSLTTNGNRAAIERTGPTGIFQFSAGAGENVVRLEVAQGYLPPTGGSAVKLSLAEGQTLELPGMWLAPLPSFRVQVVDDAMNGVPGAVVRLLKPDQFGWRVSGADGGLDLNVGSLPEGGEIIGAVESADGAHGAVFKLTAKDAGGAKVQLLPLAHLKGRITTSRGKGIAGAVVGAAFPGSDANADPVLLWKTVSGEDGAFTWDGVVPGLPQVLIARLGSGKVAQSAPFNLAPEEHKQLDALKVEGSARGVSQLGSTLALSNFPLACGAAPAGATKTIVLFASADEAANTAEALGQMLKTLAQPGLTACVVANPRPPCPATPAVPILTGSAPGAATTLILDATGHVSFETFGLPPTFALHP